MDLGLWSVRRRGLRPRGIRGSPDPAPAYSGLPNRLIVSFGLRGGPGGAVAVLPDPAPAYSGLLTLRQFGLRGGPGNSHRAGGFCSGGGREPTMETTKPPSGRSLASPAWVMWCRAGSRPPDEARNEPQSGRRAVRPAGGGRRPVIRRRLAPPRRRISQHIAETVCIDRARNATLRRGCAVLRRVRPAIRFRQAVLSVFRDRSDRRTARFCCRGRPGMAHRDRGWV